MFSLFNAFSIYLINFSMIENKIHWSHIVNKLNISLKMLKYDLDIHITRVPNSGVSDLKKRYSFSPSVQ